MFTDIKVINNESNATTHHAEKEVTKQTTCRLPAKLCPFTCGYLCALETIGCALFVGDRGSFISSLMYSTVRCGFNQVCFLWLRDELICFTPR